MYKITFNLSAPIAFIDLPMFDGLLAYAFIYQKLGYVPSPRSLNESNRIPIELPLKKENDYYLASQMFIDEEIEWVGSWKKRWDNANDDLAFFGKRKPQVQINKGEFKSYDMPIVLHSCKKVWFYFESDDLQAIENLLADIKGIGKKISQGYGLFSGYTIEKENDINFKSYLLRPMPRTLIDKANNQSANMLLLGYTLVIRQMPYKPPYWSMDSIEECVIAIKDNY